MTGSVNNTNYKIDPTVRLYSQFYDTDMVVNGDEYDLVLSYLKSVCSSRAIAENLALSIFKIANDYGFNATDILAQIQGQDRLKLTVTLSYYLNSIRNACTYLGTGSPISANPYVARNIVP